MRFGSKWLVASSLVVLAACGGESETSAEPAASPAVAPSAAAPAQAPAAAPAAAAPAAAPTAGDVVTVDALRTGFAAGQSEWVGRDITLRGLFFSATSVGGSVNNISLRASRDDDRMQSIACAFGENAPASIDLVQYTEITVTGRVRERFGRPALDDCAITP